MPLYLFYTMVQKSQKWPKTQIKGGGGPALTVFQLQVFSWYWGVLHFLCFFSALVKGLWNVGTHSPAFVANRGFLLLLSQLVILTQRLVVNGKEIGHWKAEAIKWTRRRNALPAIGDQGDDDNRPVPVLVSSKDLKGRVWKKKRERERERERESGESEREGGGGGRRCTAQWVITPPISCNERTHSVLVISLRIKIDVWLMCDCHCHLRQLLC